MIKKTFKFGFSDLNLSVSQIESLLGYGENDDRGFVINLIEEVLKEAEAICKIRAEYVILDNIKFGSDKQSIEIKNISFNIGKIIFSQLKKSESVAIFLCTAGEEIGLRSKNAMQERDLLMGYIYDLAGSEIVEAAADMFQADLEKTLSLSGQKITNRFSPGYCGWDVVEQHKLFSLIPDNFCGISLTPSALMKPVKSISGIIGLGEKVKHNPYTCNLCDMDHCIYRKVK